MRRSNVIGSAPLAVLALIFALPAAAPAQSSSASASLRAADTAWARVFSAKHLSQSVMFCDPSGSVLPPNAPKATGYAAIRRLFAGFFALPHFDASWRPNIVHVAQAGDIGYTSGVYQLSFMQKRKTISDHGKYVTVWKHEPNGSWKVLLDIFNSDLQQ